MRFSNRLHLAERSRRSRQPARRYDPAAESARPQVKVMRRQVKAKFAKPSGGARTTRRGRRATQAPAGAPAATARSAPTPLAPSAPAASSGSASGTTTVDPSFNIEGELLRSLKGNGLLAAAMNYVDPKVNADKFYVIQAIGNARGAFVCLRWGRRGAKGQQKIEGPMGPEEAEKMFESKFKAKTGLSFAERDAEALAGKYKMEKRLREAGAGKGEVAVSLMWDNTPGVKANDLDLHVTAPSGEIIYYMHKRSACGGELDVDRMQDAPEPVENVVWKRAPRGRYAVYVNNFSTSHNSPTPFKVAVAINGTSKMFDGVVGPTDSEKRKVLVTKFTI